MTDNNALEERILKIIFEVSAVAPEEIGIDDDLFVDLGMDSVSAMELIGMLDEAFELEIEIEEAMNVRTVRQVFEMARRHLANA